MKLRLGGVMRCCIATLHETYDPEDDPVPEGTTLPCNWCKSGLIVKDGAWEWWRERPK